MGNAYPKAVVCRVLGTSRSSQYYQPKVMDDSELEADIHQVCAQFPRYGYRRVTAELKRRGWQVNHKRIARRMAKLGLQARMPTPRKCRTTDCDHSYPRYPNLVKELQVERPDQVWVADITYIRLHKEFIFLAVVMDVFTRCIRGWHLDRTLDQSLTQEALCKALESHCPEIHHSDQGVQYAAHRYIEILQGHAIQISMAEVGEPTQNGYAERLMRTIKEEEVDLSEYEDYHHAYRQIGQFLEDVYMRKRVHSSLNYLTPAEFEINWLFRQKLDSQLTL
jgi:transposase InsO family protein